MLMKNDECTTLSNEKRWMHDMITDNRKNDMINGKTDKLILFMINLIGFTYDIIELTHCIIGFTQR